MSAPEPPADPPSRKNSRFTFSPSPVDLLFLLPLLAALILVPFLPLIHHLRGWFR